MLNLRKIYPKVFVLLCLVLHIAADTFPLPLQLDFAFSSRSHILSPKSRIKRNDPLGVDIEGYKNFLGIRVNTTLGTPPQHIQFLVDTSSSDLVVVSTSNPVCESSENGCDLGIFDESKSSTFTDLGSNFSVSFVDGSQASGKFCKDDLNIGGTTIGDLQFGLAQNSTSLSENVLGLGYISSESGSESYANLPWRLHVDGITNIIGYSIWFDGPNSTNGKLALGSIDTGKFNGTLETLPIELNRSSLSYDYKTIGMTSMSISTDNASFELDNTSTSVVLDAGSSAILLPASVYTQIVSYLGAVMDNTLGWPVQNRSALRTDVTLDFAFDGTTVQVPVSDLAVPIDYDRVGLALGPADNIPNILGVPFLRNAFVVFDYSHNQISLAQASYSTKSNLTLIGQNGAIGLTSTAQTSDLVGSSKSNTDGSITSTDKIAIGVGIGLGILFLLAVLGTIFLIQKKGRRTVMARHAYIRTVSEDGVNQYVKAELAATSRVNTTKEKAELSTDYQRHELESKNAVPAELPASMPEPREMATEGTVSEFIDSYREQRGLN